MESKAELRAVFDRVVLESLAPLSLGLAIAFTMFTVLGVIEGYPPEAFVLVVGTDVTSALIYYALYFLLRRGKVPPRRANIVGVAGGQLALINALVTYLVLRDPFFLVYVPMVVIGYGSFLLSRRWFAASVVCAAVLSLAATVSTLPPQLVWDFAPAFFGAALLGTVLLVVRRWSVQTADAALRAARSEIAERRRVEARLAQSQRLESVGQLVSGVAHDFNNLLMPIIGYADMALGRLDANDPLRADLVAIRNAGESAAALTAKLLAFSRQQALQTRVLDINDVVESTRNLLERTVREDIELVFDLDPEAGHVRIDAVQMQQVLLNLAANARDAMPEGGRLTIATRAVGRDADGAGPFVVLRVADTGIGIGPQVREHLFEPFFTTKEKGRGTGLGLATAHGIVSQSGGRITVDSAPGRGAQFCIELPRAAAPERGRSDRAERAPEPGGGETVLLVEDERQVRAVVTAALRSHGFLVLEAGSPHQALSIAAREPFDVLVTDVVMPGMNGIELATTLRARGGDVPVVFMSGYAPDDAVRNTEILRGVNFVPKPFRARDLVAAVQVALEASRSTPAPPQPANARG